MKFLVDVGVDRGVETWLKKTGHDVLSMLEVNCRVRHRDSPPSRWRSTNDRDYG
jgi:hypothetical protein